MGECSVAGAAGSILALCIAHCAAVVGVESAAAGQQLRYTGLPRLPPRSLSGLRRLLQKKFTKNELKKFSISRIVWVDFLRFSFFFFCTQCAEKTFAKMLQKYETN